MADVEKVIKGLIRLNLNDAVRFKLTDFGRDIYGWRCWTSRPTDEQREAVKWDEPI